LAIDPANEVTIDNRVTGANGDDPLIIQSLVSKPSIVKLVQWSSSVPANTIIQHGTVTPAILRATSGTSQNLHYYTPSGWVAAAFRFWRGGMRYTFRVVRSKYHRGRLIVCWDPNGTLATLGVETAVFSKIFDLSSPDQEFTMDIPYKAASPWLKTTTSNCLQSTPSTIDYSAFNGHFVLGVLNPLTGPTASALVDILVSAEALDDMEFAAPTALPLNTTSATIQSGVVSEQVVDGSSVKYSDRIPDITVGERIGSLRTLLHRTTRAMTQWVGLNTDTNYSLDSWCFHCVNCFDRLPPVYGFQPADSYNWGTSVLATGPKPCNYATNHPINWVLNAFAGYRGSVVVHANVSTNGNIENISGMSLTRIDHNFSGVNTPNNVVRNTTFNYFGLNSGAGNLGYQTTSAVSPGPVVIPIWPTGAGGTTVTNGKTQMAMSAVIPQYARTRFMPSAFTQPNTDFVDTVYDGSRLDVDFGLKEGVTDNQQWPRVDMYWAAGVDFNPVFFTGVPRLYNYQPPTSYLANV